MSVVGRGEESEDLMTGEGLPWNSEVRFGKIMSSSLIALDTSVNDSVRMLKSDVSSQKARERNTETYLL